MIRKLKSGQYRLYSRKQEGPENRQKTKSGDFRNARRGAKARTGSAVLQKEIGRARLNHQLTTTTGNKQAAGQCELPDGDHSSVKLNG